MTQAEMESVLLAISVVSTVVLITAMIQTAIDAYYVHKARRAIRGADNILKTMHERSTMSGTINKKRDAVLSANIDKGQYRGGKPSNGAGESD